VLRTLASRRRCCSLRNLSSGWRWPA